MNMITNVQSNGATEREASVKARVAQLSRRQKISLAALPVALIGAAILWESRGAPVAAAPPPPGRYRCQPARSANRRMG